MRAGEEGETPDDDDDDGGDGAVAEDKTGAKDEREKREKAEARLPLIQRDLIRATNFAGELIECCRRDWRCADYCMPV